MTEARQCGADQCSLSALQHLSCLVNVILGSGDGEHSHISSFRRDVDPRLSLLSHLTITKSPILLKKITYIVVSTVMPFHFHCSLAFEVF